LWTVLADPGTPAPRRPFVLVVVLVIESFRSKLIEYDDEDEDEHEWLGSWKGGHCSHPVARQISEP
jgi:hypothetical protein